MIESLKAYRMLKSYLFLFLFLGLFSACDKSLYEAEIPSYLTIEKIDVETNSVEGSASNKITDAWITMDGIFLGAFELPCTIPILDSGVHEFSIYSGIKANGISATRIRYPFYERCELYMNNGDDYQLINNNNIELFRDSTVSVKAITRYEDVDFLLLEDFEDAGTIIEPSDISDTSLIKTNIDSLVFEGYGSGAVYLDQDHNFFEFVSSEFIVINAIYNATYLELDYKCDHPFKVGVAIKDGSSGIVNKYESIQIAPSQEWNKIYIHMTPQINLGTSVDEFGIFIGAVKSNTSESASFYFDNIKWLHGE